MYVWIIRFCVRKYFTGRKAAGYLKDACCHQLSWGVFKERWNKGFPKPDSVNEIETKEVDKFRICQELAKHDIGEMVKICISRNMKVIIASYPRCGGILDICHKEIAQNFRVPFVDNAAFFAKPPDLNDYLWKDGIHPNERGYGLVAENILNCIVGNKMLKDFGA